MKLTKVLLALAITMTLTILPTKKAEAAVLFVPLTAVGIIGVGGYQAAMISAGIGATGILLAPATDDIGAFVLFAFGGISLILLNEEAQNLELSLAHQFPELPSYALSEAAFMVQEKAKLLPTDINREVTLSEAEFFEIEQVMPSDVNQEQLQGLKNLLTK
jgi:hypothetical protein